jgi:hypothetical protein
MVNAHKFKELFQNITEDGESIDGNVDKMNELLTGIFEKYTKVELDRTIVRILHWSEKGTQRKR